MVDFSHMGGVAEPTYDKEGKLVKLVLSGLSSIDGLNIRDLSDLKSLEIRDCNFLNFPVPLLSHCDALEELVIDNIFTRNNPISPSPIAKFPSYLANLKNLRILKFTNNFISHSEELKIIHTRDIKDACNQTYNRKEQIFPKIQIIEICGNSKDINISDEIKSCCRYFRHNKFELTNSEV